LMLHVHRGPNLGDIYISDKTGANFTLSLANNICNKGLCAFEKVMNLNGIYVANVRVDASANTPGRDAPEPSAPIEEGAPEGSQSDQSIRWRRLQVPSSEQRRLASSQPYRHSGIVRTVISFDSGGAWTYLRHPKVDSNGQRIRCPDNSCWLHLHDFTELHTFAPVYSYKNALGIIMGSGNVGSSLSNNPAHASTYLSRDGGLTWMEGHAGTYIYEFGNHGGLLVMADMVRNTQQVIYSWDEGQTWVELNFTDTPMHVQNVIIEPDATATKFLLYGDRGRNGVIKMLDFGSLHPRLCTGIDKAGKPDSDYENWTPTDGEGPEKCTLGRHTTYTRRKQLSRCFNSETAERPVTSKKCACTKESFECGIGFKRAVGSLDCSLDVTAEVSQDRMKRACAAAGGQITAEAYRKVPRDECEGGWKPDPGVVPCSTSAKSVESTPPAASAPPTQSIESNTSGGHSFFASVMLIGMVAGAVYLWSTGKLNHLLPQSTSQPPSSATTESTGVSIGKTEAEMVTTASRGEYRPPLSV